MQGGCFVCVHYFPVDYTEPLKALAWVQEGLDWPRGEFLDGHEFLLTITLRRRDRSGPLHGVSLASDSLPHSSSSQRTQATLIMEQKSTLRPSGVPFPDLSKSAALSLFVGLGKALTIATSFRQLKSESTIM